MNILKSIIHILEIKESLKEKRIKSRQNLDNKSKNIIRNISNRCSLIFDNEKLALLGSLAIIIVSILVRSTRDIGYNSAVAIDLTSILASNDGYFSYIINNSSSLTFYINLLPYFISKLTAINIIISHFIFSNLFGILAIFASAKILQRTQIYNNKSYFNVIILSFAGAYFLRIFNLSFNEFSSVTSHFLAIALPYICYQLLDEKNIKKSDQLIMGFLAATIFALDTNYGSLVIGLEIAKSFNKKSVVSFFNVRNAVTTILLALYVTFLIDDIAAILPKLYLAKYLSAYLFNLKEHLSLVILLFLIFKEEIKSNATLKFFVGISILSIAIIIGSSQQNLDKISIFYSLSLPAICLITINFIKSKKINFLQNWFFIIPLLFLPLLSQQEYGDIITNIPNLWWIFTIFIALKYRRYANKLHRKNLIDKIVIPLNMLDWLLLLLILSCVFLLNSFAKTNHLIWLVNIYFFYSLITLDQKNSLKLKSKISSKLYTLSIIAILCHIFGLVAQGIIANNNQNLANKLKSPNQISEQIIKNIKTYSDNEKALIIGDNICDRYPVTKYFSQNSDIKNISYNSLYGRISHNNNHHQFLDKLANQEFLQLMKNIKNKNEIIIVKNYDSQIRRDCQIGFLEFYLRNEEFRQIFINNYKFVNRIVEFEAQNPTITIEKKSRLQQELDRNNYIKMLKDYEVYRVKK